MVSLKPEPFIPTDEQAAIVSAVKTGSDVVIEAGAGTGKTRTLRLIGESDPKRRGRYFAFNRAIADDAKATFPSNVVCSTAHSMAFGTVGKAYSERLSGPRIPGWKLAQLLDLKDALTLTDGGEEKEITPVQLARLASQTVGRFCNSDDDELWEGNVPGVNGVTKEMMKELRAFILPLAVEIWEDVQLPRGKFKFEHDHYLKIWALSRPRISADYILFDEAQDANPVLAGVVERQKHLQRILVGDASQAIYAWRGAVDAMSEWSGIRQVLSQSFRFGPRVASEANKWLTLLDANLRLKGYDKIASVTGNGILMDMKRGSEEKPDAILCRTNSGALSATIAAISAGLNPAMVGGSDGIERLARAADDLQNGKKTEHPDLFMFDTWAEVKDYVKEDEGGSDLRTLVKMVDDFGVEAIIDAARSCVDEDRADIVISTAHRAKGREWDKVRVFSDFPQPTEEKPLTREDYMLNYVTVTRAKKVLDKAALSWVDDLGKTGGRR